MPCLAHARHDDRPTAANFGVGGVAIFAIAANDNGARERLAANALNQYPSVGGYTYSYWPEGGLKETDTLAANYDELGSMIEGFTTLSPGVIDPAYGEYVGVDALGHKYFHEAQTVAGQTYPLIHHATDGLQPETILEWVYQGLNGAPRTLQGTRRYVMGPDPDERWAFIGVSGAVYSPHTDREGTLIALSNGGVVSQIYTWDAYGRNTNTANENSTGPAGYLYRYTGQRFDPNTGLHDYKPQNKSTMCAVNDFAKAGDIIQKSSLVVGGLGVLGSIVAPEAGLPEGAVGGSVIAYGIGTDLKNGTAFAYMILNGGNGSSIPLDYTNDQLLSSVPDGPIKNTISSMLDSAESKSGLDAGDTGGCAL